MLDSQDTAMATGKVRMNFCNQHLVAGRAAALRIHRAETENARAEFGAFFVEIINDSVTAVVMSVAAIDAFIGEVEFTRERNFPGLAAGDAEAVFERVRMKPTLVRMKALIAARPNNTFALDLSKDIGQRTFALIELRNRLVHYSPDWLAGGVHTDTILTIKKHVTPSPFLPASEDLFPRRWMSYRSASWAVRTAREFVMHVANGTGWECDFYRKDEHWAMP